MLEDVVVEPPPNVQFARLKMLKEASIVKVNLVAFLCLDLLWPIAKIVFNAPMLTLGAAHLFWNTPANEKKGKINQMHSYLVNFLPESHLHL